MITETIKNKVALVTGASGGIGSAIAKSLYDKGAILALTGRRQEALESCCKNWDKNRYGLFNFDLADWKKSDALIADVEKKLGPIDILVNNAGVTRDKLLMMMKVEDWQDVIDTNLSASFSLTRNVIRGMIKRKSGSILGITSIIAVSGNAGQSNYAAAKAGVIGFYKSIAQEVAKRGITVNCIAPGFIVTAMTDKLSAVQKDLILQKIPMSRFGTVEDIANAASFLLSSDASYITGQTIHVNGGMLMV